MSSSCDHGQRELRATETTESGRGATPPAPNRRGPPSIPPLVARELDKGAGDDTSHVFRFYAARLAEPDDDGEPLDLDVLTRVAVERLELSQN
jgi:hypothetical protein